MSPAKPTSHPQSPHQHPGQGQQMTLSPRPANATSKSTSSQGPPTYPQQSTLQQLEQLVMPGVTTSATDYPPYRSAQQQWQPRGPHNGNMGAMSDPYQSSVSNDEQQTQSSLSPQQQPGQPPPSNQSSSSQNQKSPGIDVKQHPDMGSSGSTNGNMGFNAGQQGPGSHPGK